VKSLSVHAMKTVVSFIIHFVEQEASIQPNQGKPMKKALHRDAIRILDLGITSTTTLVLVLTTDSVSFIHGIDSVLIGIALKVVERFENSILAHEDIAVDEVW
jgi:hypothetical protein